MGYQVRPQHWYLRYGLLCCPGSPWHECPAQAPQGWPRWIPSPPDQGGRNEVVPLHCVLLGQAVRESNVANLAAPVLDIHARATQDNIEVHTVDTNAGVVLDTQINMFLDSKAEVAIVRKVLLSQLVLLNLEATLQDLLGLGAPPCERPIFFR